MKKTIAALAVAKGGKNLCMVSLFAALFLFMPFVSFAQTPEQVCASWGGVQTVSSPDLSNVCNNLSVSIAVYCNQPINGCCFAHITVPGTKSPLPWAPDPSTIFEGKTFSQTSGCGTQNAIGTMPITWFPATLDVASGRSFSQVNSSGTTRAATGTKSLSSFPSASQVCSGTTTSKYDECGSLGTITGTKDCSAVCTPNGSQIPAVTDIGSGVSFQAVDSCGRKIATSLTGTKPSTWLPVASEIGSGVSFNQVNTCGNTKAATGAKAQVSVSPIASSVCNGKSFTQVNNWGKVIGSTGALDYISWWSDPTPDRVCIGSPVVQINGCTTREVPGTNPGYWVPSASSVCKGQPFDQANICTGVPNPANPIIGTKTTCAPFVLLTATPPSINVGESSTLTWSADATVCTASASPADSAWTGLKTVSGGSLPVSPSVTTTYMLTCTKPGYVAPAAASATVTVNSVSGSCGPPNGTISSTAPTLTAASCTAGTMVPDSDPWSWTCQGSGGGTNANCIVNKPMPGGCGSDNGKALSAAPTNVCDSFSSLVGGSLNGTGPWDWECQGAYNGTTVPCSAQIFQSSNWKEVSLPK